MSRKIKIVVSVILIVDFLLLAMWALNVFTPSLNFGNFDLLTPQGIIAHKQKHLLITAVGMMLVVAIPVYFLLFYFIFKFRKDKTSKHSPNLDSKYAPLIWIIPITLMVAIGALNWKSTHELDPYKTIASEKKPITIQVVALQWKWLFIYPEQNIATVNFVEFPKGTPVTFELTADAPMNSFWIPQLGGQMYAMAGMSTKLNLMANDVGTYNGSSAEISGRGFAGMRFTAKSVSDDEFNSWVNEVRQSKEMLHTAQYNKLAEPSENNSQIVYSMVEEDLYNKIMEKFMKPSKVNK